MLKAFKTKRFDCIEKTNEHSFIDLAVDKMYTFMHNIWLTALQTLIENNTPSARVLNKFCWF